MRSTLVVVSLVLVFSSRTSFSLEPLTMGLAAGSVAVSGIIYAGWNKVQCQFTECCTEPWVANNLTLFEEKFRNNVFGQHLVLQLTMRALKSHLKKSKPSKALVLSFHGWTGSGKNYVSKFIAESLYSEGMRSRFVHLFMSSLHFPNAKMVDEYKLNLQDWIRGNVSACEQSLFIFDEIDKAPEGVIDAIKPFIDYHESISGVDFRKAIFIFLSNTGGREITSRAFDHWTEGKARERLQHTDFEALINAGAFNEQGGLHHSEVIGRSLVDLFVPFLPLEKRHVKDCIKVEAGKKTLTTEDINRVISQLTFWPPNVEIFSTTGCKRVAQKLDLLFEEQYDDL